MIRNVAFTALLLCVGCEGVLGGTERGSQGDLDSEAARAKAALDKAALGKDGENGSSILSTTPVPRLTNQEFVASIAQALKLPGDSPALQEAATGLPSEPTIGGLRNDAAAQLITNVVFSSYSSFVSRVSEIFFEGVDDEEGLRGRLSCAEDVGMDACVSDFVSELRSAAYRRDLTEAEKEEIQSEWSAFDQLVVETGAEGSAFEIAKMRVENYILSTFLSPGFVLQVEVGSDSDSNIRPLQPHEVATRLAYFLTGNPPDEELRKAASSGGLSAREGRIAQAERLMMQPAARKHVVALVTAWLEINDRSTPEWNEYLETFIGEWFDEEKPFSDFYQGPVTVSHLDGSESEEPLGVLGSHAFLASHTSYPTAAFITRGVSVVEDLLCAELPDDIPLEAFNSEAVSDFEVFTEHAQLPCASCHRIFDNYGAALHQFDAKTGLYVPGESSLGSGFPLFEFDDALNVVDDPQSLSAVMASSEKAAGCVANFWYRNAGRQGVRHNSSDEVAAGDILDAWRGESTPSLKALFLEIIGGERFATLVLPE